MNAGPSGLADALRAALAAHGRGELDEAAAELDRRSGLASRNTPTLASGERVRHAEYGEGTVAGVSGMGPRQVATVTFDGAAGVRRFIVSHGALERI